MKLQLHSQAAKVLSTLTCFSILAGCGGGGDAGSGTNSTELLGKTVTAPAPTATGNNGNGNGTTPATSNAGGNSDKGSTTTTTTDTSSYVTAPAPTPTTGTSTSTGSYVTAPAPTPTTDPSTSTSTSGSTSTAPVNGPTVTDFRIQSTNATTAQTNVPVTFGQVFAVGAVAPTDALVGRLDDGTTVPLQVDVKALHADGSVRHAIISAVLPTLGAGQMRTISMIKSGKVAATTALATTNMMSNGFSASVSATINGVKYSAFADDLIKTAAHQTWLAGNVVNEWQVSAPLKTSSGAAHPHLSARFAIRWYQNVKKARVDVTVENDWAYEPNPQNFTYDAAVLVGGKQAYAKTGMTHYHHARWRKVFWWNGDTPQINIKHNIPYLLATGAVPNYDQTVSVPDSALADLATRYTGAVTEPMGIGLGVPYMLMTGGRPDIGLMPQWSTLWLLTMDQRARTATLGTADGAGSWSAHYRDKNTDRPVSLLDFPYMTIYGNASDTYNPATKQREAFPLCATTAGACDTPYTHDPDHQPAFAYLPYLMTGDYYYLEELQFWAMWDAFASNPAYRQYAKGLVTPEQVRGQAWCLRTLAEAAYITPDTDRLKSHFASIVDSNLDWYNANYTNNASANQLGVITNGYAMAYNSSTGLAPWQDDFFTSVIGHAADMGFAKAKTFLVWKSKFAVDRMTATGTCWIDGSIYALNIRDTSTSPFYTTMGEAYTKNHTATFNALACGSTAMATALNLKVGEMTGYSSDPAGYPSNLQPALAYASDALGSKGKAAWTVFMNRSVKPNYGSQPQFAIVPRY
ncbi:hypothetical protein GCM10027321_37930 [Massilia terrae]|uniref:PcRGLX/YetA-like N-terminal RIFT barrel domain-containing protein n=1 Tax=Massilia terrae TaxID=1811224 RepID=A0ABT2D4B0_9BURK|nr:hypothetical protein [Massilia terrae]MCS0661078.1 hypothetical protein [Massilia terrae]